jgi:hypothetical protein
LSELWRWCALAAFGYRSVAEKIPKRFLKSL